jgi:RNA polymerase sigma-70 factor (ECF subfamily)
LAEQLDKELVQQVLDGRVDAFNLLVWRWQRPLYNFLYRMTGEREQARDLAQEAFLRAYTRLRDLKEPDKFGAWLYRIALNQHRSHLRTHAAQEAQWSPEIDTELEAPVTVAARELRITVRALVGRLTPEQREVVLLKIYDGFKFEEIAEILGCPASTVKSRLYAAFDQLRAGLEAPALRLVK